MPIITTVLTTPLSENYEARLKIIEESFANGKDTKSWGSVIYSTNGVYFPKNDKNEELGIILTARIYQKLDGLIANVPSATKGRMSLQQKCPDFDESHFYRRIVFLDHNTKIGTNLVYSDHGLSNLREIIPVNNAVRAAEATSWEKAMLNSVPQSGDYNYNCIKHNFIRNMDDHYSGIINELVSLNWSGRTSDTEMFFNYSVKSKNKPYISHGYNNKAVDSMLCAPTPGFK